MSGAAGGTRIPRAAVEQTVKDFVNNILSKIPGFKSAKISGSYNQPVKQDFGDIDLVVSIETDQPKKEVKKMIVDYFEGLSDKELPYLNTEKHKGKKAINHGEIISNLYPISGMPGEFVQVDNIIAVSESEGDFKKVVLDYPAEIQGLILGLVKTPLLEEDPEQVFKRMGIKDVPSLGPNQEYEFHLDTSGLSLKIVTLDENYRQLDSNVVWESTSWEDVKRLLKDFNLDGTFQQFIEKIKKFKNPRSKNRVKGFFKTSIKVGPAEKGTPKGDGKQQALDTVAALQERYGSFVMGLIRPLLLEQEGTIAIFPGKFKPPHKDHLARIQAAAKIADQVRVLIGPNPVAKNDEAAVSAQESLAIFDLYKKKNLVPDNVTFEISDIPSPVLKAYQEFEANPEQKYVAIFGKDDAARFKGLAKMPNVTINNFPEANIGDSSATDLRKAIAARDIAAIKQFLPFGVSPSEYLDALNMPEKEPLQETYKGKRTKDGAPGTLKAKISKLYGGDVTIEKARKLKNRENATPHDKRQANWFINFHSKNESSDPQSGEAAPYGSGYKPLEEELAPYITDLTKHMYDQGLTIDPAPEIEFVEDQDNAKDPLGKTAYYDPNKRLIVLYVTGRHPKDILRSFAHEMIHHCQNLEGRLGDIHTTNVNEDDFLKALEREAYERGNMSFRSWENSLRGDNGVRYIKGFAPSDHNDEPIMAEGKYDSLSNKLSGMVFRKWKEDFEAGNSESHFEQYIIDEKTGLEFDLTADAEFVDQDIYSVDGGANAGNQDEDAFIHADFKIDIQQLPRLWEKIAFDLKDFMRHEIEHLTQQGTNLIRSKKRNSDQARREKIKAGELPTSKYPTLRSEIEPMLQGMYFSAKKQRRPFIDVINDWFESRGFSQEEKRNILKIWKPYLKQLSLPKF
jgi:nicotinamide mononucleotide adenylyltransferase